MTDETDWLRAHIAAQQANEAADVSRQLDDRLDEQRRDNDRRVDEVLGSDWRERWADQ
jgi:hypothetical protein